MYSSPVHLLPCPGPVWVPSLGPDRLPDSPSLSSVSPTETPGRPFTESGLSDKDVSQKIHYRAVSQSVVLLSDGHSTLFFHTPRPNLEGREQPETLYVEPTRKVHRPNHRKPDMTNNRNRRTRRQCHGGAHPRILVVCKQECRDLRPSGSLPRSNTQEHSWRLPVDVYRWKSDTGVHFLSAGENPVFRVGTPGWEHWSRLGIVEGLRGRGLL